MQRYYLVRVVYLFACFLSNLIFYFDYTVSYLRVDVSKNERSGGQSSKFDFAYTLYIGRSRYYTYEIKVYLPEYCFVSNKFDFNCKRYFSP